MKKISFSKKELSNLIIHPDESLNKYSRGSCVLLAGSNKYPGAALLCSRAAQMSGSGYTKLFTEEINVALSAFYMPSIPVDSLENFDQGLLNSKRPQCFVIGPGFDSQDTRHKNLINQILDNSIWPVVMDGRALSLVSNDEIIEKLKIRESKSYPTIITPHKGEADKIFYNFYNESYKDNFDLAIKLYELTSCIVVLKDSDTYIVDSNNYYCMKDGTSALAKAGSGDVLAGILGGFLCQDKIDSFKACVISAHIHANAGVLASKDLTDISVCPEDLINYISKSIKNLS